MRYLIAFVMLAIGCGEGATDINPPPKPSCLRADVEPLIECPEGRVWLVIWEHYISESDVIDSEVLLDGEELPPPWVRTPAEACVNPTDYYDWWVQWDCDAELCRRYAYRVPLGDAGEEEHMVACNAENDSVSLKINTLEEGREVSSIWWLWNFGAETPERVILTDPDPDDPRRD